MTFLTSLGLTLWIFAALTCLCRSSHRVTRRLDRRPESDRVMTIRLGGWLLLAGSAGAAVALYAWGTGLSFLFGAISLTALPAIGMATYRPQWLMPLCSIALLPGVVLGVSGLITLL